MKYLKKYNESNNFYFKIEGRSLEDKKNNNYLDKEIANHISKLGFGIPTISTFQYPDNEKPFEFLTLCIFKVNNKDIRFRIFPFEDEWYEVDIVIRSIEDRWVSQANTTGEYWCGRSIKINT